jgi:hypothetical protein
VTSADVVRLRLHHSGLSRSSFKSVVDAVSHLGAVQAQDFAAAKWALGLRVSGSTDQIIEGAFNRGAILRTHVLRPTWHFVSPEDIRWMIKLSAPRVRAVMAHSNRKLELDASLLARSNAAIVKAVRAHEYATREELKRAMERVGTKTDVQRLAHMVMLAELDGLICSGPRRGKQFTYALLDERAPETKRRDRDEAMSDLAQRYFASHGPAQLKDFAWWSGLTVKDAEEALDLIRSKLRQELVNGKTHWSGVNARGRTPRPPAALLLSIYDEYTIAYWDRSDISEARDVERMISRGNALTSVIILCGNVAGTWRRELRRNAVEIRLSPFRRPSAAEREALESEADRYGRFIGMPTTIV